MSRKVVVEFTLAQAAAAYNACDLIADAYDADGDKREAALYHRACDTIGAALKARTKDEADE